MKDFDMFWVIIGSIVILLTGGFAKLASAILNRLLSTPHSKRLVRPFEFVQFLLMPLYGLFLLIRLRTIGLQLLNQASLFTVLTPLDVALISIGAFGLVVLVASTIAFQCYSPPRCQISDNSQTFDFRQSTAGKRWQDVLVGPGPMRSVALLPGNQQFQIQVSTKTYSLPRLPVEWDGLSIVHLADLHFRGAVSLAYFQQVCDQAAALKPDLFVFTGDLLDDIALLDWLPQTLGRLKAPLGQYFILGNHDWYLDPSAIKREFDRLGWIDLAGRSMHLPHPHAGPEIVLAGDETPWMGTHPAVSSAAQQHFQILLSHTPDNIHWAQNNSIDLMLAGHTHGGQIRLPVLGPIYSPSRYGCRFASGVFWLNPTLLYVSRGISGKEPVRYGCLPELIKLVLKKDNSTAS